MFWTPFDPFKDWVSICKFEALPCCLQWFKLVFCFLRVCRRGFADEVIIVFLIAVSWLNYFGLNYLLFSLFGISFYWFYSCFAFLSYLLGSFPIFLLKASAKLIPPPIDDYSSFGISINTGFLCSISILFSFCFILLLFALIFYLFYELILRIF